MSTLRRLAREAFHSAGGLHAARALTRRGVRILMYHRFPGAGCRAALERRCAHIRKYYNPLPLSAIARAWRDGGHLPPNTVSVTVDDGYRDFYDVAYPVLASFRIPVTVYLVSDFMDGRCWLWFDRLQYVFEQTRATKAEIPLAPGNSILVRLGSPAERKSAAKAVIEAAKRMPDAQRIQLVDELPALLGVELPDLPPPQYAPLTWDSVREMGRMGVDFGPHTRTHPILSRLCEEQRLQEEIDGSRNRIEAETGKPSTSFCYPNGRYEDIGEKVLERVRQSGFETAVVTAEGLNYPGCNPLLLKRIPADPSYSELFFQEYLAGVRVR